jgi:bacterioferritin-associated ferredoxin
MSSCCSNQDRCSDRLVCRCLGVTEAIIVDAVGQFGLCTLAEVRRCTGAGDGCTACHKLIRRLLEDRAAPAVAGRVGLATLAAG